jgi:hypothetical protein
VPGRSLGDAKTRSFMVATDYKGGG